MEVQTLTNVILGVCSGVAIIVSLYTYYNSRQVRCYADIDTLYLELLKLGITYPNFVNPKYTSDYKNAYTGDELNKYETYAFISWNICETIYDRKNEALFETWKPVIVAENKLHRKWFDQPENFHKFKERFREYIQNTFPQEYKK